MRRYAYSLLAAVAIVAGGTLLATPTLAQATTPPGPETPLNTRIDRIRSATGQAMTEAASLLRQGQAAQARQTLEAAEANLLSAEQFDISQAPDIDQQFGGDIATMQAAIDAIWKHQPRVALDALESKTAPTTTGPAVTFHSLMPPIP